MAGRRFAIFSLFALVALALAALTTSGTHAQSYDPIFTYTVADNTHDAASDTTDTLDIYAPDYNYEDSSLYTFSPIEGSSVAGAAIPIADDMGSLSALSTVGLMGGPCSTPLPPVFTLENASIDTSDELNSDEMYWLLKDSALVRVPYLDKCENDIDDDGDTFINDGCPQVGDNSETVCNDDVSDDTPAPDTTEDDMVGDPFINDGCPVEDGTGELRTDPNIADYLEAYPFFINDMLDPPGADPPLEPHARYAGYTTVAGMHILVQFVVLDPGQLMALGGIKAQIGPELGRPSMVVLNNPVSGEEAPGAISDFCTPLNTTTDLLGTVGVTEVRWNPAEDTGVLGTGTHMARQYSQSERDADGDGIENDLDPCHYTDDSGWDPRAIGGVGTGDHDNDGLPDSCDPDPRGSAGDADTDDCTGTQGDCDGDGYNNRQDICPLVPNGCNVPECSPEFIPNFDPTWDNMADDDAEEPNADLGPSPDSIGNSCDDSDDDGNEDGAGVGTCNDGLDNGCVDALDNAEDGVADGIVNDGCRAVDIFADCDDDDDGNCTDPGEAAKCANADDDDADGVINDGCPPVGVSEADGADGNDSDCQPSMDKAEPDPWGANPGTGQFYHALPWAAVTINAAVDTDGDGYSDTLECGTGTYPACSAGSLGSDPDDSGSVPESLVIDMYISAGPGPNPQPAAQVAQSCNDGVDNDDDGKTDRNDNDDLGCDPTDDSYSGDADRDGVVDDGGTDNCAKVGTCSIWNPEQVDSDADTIGDACDGDIVDLVTDSDGDTVVDRCDNCPNDDSSTDQTDTDWDHQGDICDDDDDNDGFTDILECDGTYPGTCALTSVGTDPLAHCTNNPGVHDAWPLDVNIDKFVTVGGDVLPYRGNIGAPVTAGLLQRLNLNGDGYITVGGDVLPFRGNIGGSCS